MIIIRRWSDAFGVLSKARGERKGQRYGWLFTYKLDT